MTGFARTAWPFLFDHQHPLRFRPLVDGGFNIETDEGAVIFHSPDGWDRVKFHIAPFNEAGAVSIDLEWLEV